MYLSGDVTIIRSEFRTRLDNVSTILLERPYSCQYDERLAGHVGDLLCMCVHVCVIHACARKFTHFKTTTKKSFYVIEQAENKRESSWSTSHARMQNNRKPSTVNRPFIASMLSSCSPTHSCNNLLWWSLAGSLLPSLQPKPLASLATCLLQPTWTWVPCRHNSSPGTQRRVCGKATKLLQSYQVGIWLRANALALWKIVRACTTRKHCCVEQRGPPPLLRAWAKLRNMRNQHSPWR